MLKRRGGNVTPKLFNAPCDQSNANSLHRDSRETYDEPIHNALVLSRLFSNPDIM